MGALSKIIDTARSVLHDRRKTCLHPLHHCIGHYFSCLIKAVSVAIMTKNTKQGFPYLKKLYWRVGAIITTWNKNSCSTMQTTPGILWLWSYPLSSQAQQLGTRSVKGVNFKSEMQCVRGLLSNQN